MAFEKAYWRVEPTIKEEQKELASSTLKSIALNYSFCKSRKVPKQIQTAVNQQKRNNNIAITKPDKGSGVVVMDKTEYIHLLSEASFADTTKFSLVSKERPKKRGRPAKNYHPLLEKEKDLPKEIANVVCTEGSRLAHLYGLPKTHKKTLSMQPIISTIYTYNYALAKWLHALIN